MYYRKNIIDRIIDKILDIISKKQTVTEEQKELQYYLNLTTEELTKLDDMKLYKAISIRIDNKNSIFYSEEEKVVYQTMKYDNEVNNGGLCQFFTNSSAKVAPYISNNLKILKAKEYKKLFDNFIKDNKIDVNDFSSFKILSTDNIQEKYEENPNKYTFDEFDKEFYKLTPLQTTITEYIKQNIEKF